MRKTLVFVMVLVSLCFGFVAYAGPNINELTGQIAQKGGYQTVGVTDTTLSQTIGMIISIVLGLLGMIFLALTVYAGFLWMTAAGDEEHISTAKKILKSSVIGLIIVLAAYSITYFVTNYLSAASSPMGNTVSGVNVEVEANGPRGCCFSVNHQCSAAYVDLNLPSDDPRYKIAERNCLNSGGALWNNCAEPCP